MMTSAVGFQLGLDTGGTYTDAVLVNDEQQVLASAKSLTTHANLIDGLRGAVDSIVSADIAADIDLVSLSTTLATNALVEGRGRPVALVLIGFTPSQLQRANLQQALGGDPMVFLDGGHDAAGQPVAEFDAAGLRGFVEEVDDRVEAYAISSMFAVRNPAHENEARALLVSLTGKPISCGHHLSSGLDAPRRALTSLLNARLIPMTDILLKAARELLQQHGIKAPLMVVKGDGSLIRDELALSRPVETILSGPAASVVGAQFLCQEKQLLVADMGGTTTDVALIRDGQPRLSADGAVVGGWRTMVEAIDVRTHGLGGDSRIQFDREQRQFLLQPQRILPLSLLIHRYPELLRVLESQLALPFTTSHGAQFVLAHGPAGNTAGLSAQQRELYERVGKRPVALQSLFSDQTLERALTRLEQRGLVLRAGFTPTDAAHVLGQQSGWSDRAANLGARLLMRYAKDNLGPSYPDEASFCKALSHTVSSDAALLLLDAAASGSMTGRGLCDSQKRLIRSGFEKNQGDLLHVQASLQLPVIALGAPARSYYPATAHMLDTRLVLCEHAQVANALGAVVGSVRQQHHMVITPAGGESVSVHLPTGPQIYPTLEEAVSAATVICKQLALEKVQQAGGFDTTVSVERHDKVVTRDGRSTFLESRISAMAAGRPSGWHES